MTRLGGESFSYFGVSDFETGSVNHEKTDAGSLEILSPGLFLCLNMDPVMVHGGMFP